MKKVLNVLTEKKNEMKKVWNGLDGARKAYIMTVGISGIVGYAIGYAMKKAYEYGLEDQA